MYDLAIIGGGPAAVAAGVYASRKRLKTIFITKDWGGQSTVSEDIQNWIGTPSISGTKLASSLKDHLKVYAGDIVDVREGQFVENVEKVPEGFKVTAGNESYLTKTVLIASGSSRRKLSVPRSEQYENKGIVYCASCDGPLFADMDVAVICGGNAGFETAAQLLAYCKSVTLLNRSDTFRADEITVEKVLKNPKMKAIKNVDILEVQGDKFVEGLLYKDMKTGETKELKVSGIFVEIGQIPNTDFVKDILPLDKIGRIKIDPKTQKTEVPGIWAAGDCTDVLYHQNNIAAGDAVRALEAIYLAIHTK